MSEEDWKTDKRNEKKPEIYALWQQFKSLKTDKEKQAFIETHPDLTKDWRAEYRLAHPEDDARLAVWGYGGKLQSMDAYNLVEQWSKELGIPLEQMGLGLPPRNFIGNYFELNKIVLETSGGSIEARLYKVEHPEYLTWGVENWGWDDLSDENINALRLRVQWKDQFTEYDAYGDKNSDKYEANDTLRATMRNQLLWDNPEFARARRQIEAWDVWFPDELVDTYVEYYTKFYDTEGTRGTYEDDWFLMEHPDFYEAMCNPEIMGNDAWDPGNRDFSKVPTREVGELYKEYQKEAKGDAREEFRRQHLDLDAWGVLALGWKPISAQGAPKVLTPMEKIFEVYKKLPYGNARLDFRRKNPEFDYWLVTKKGYKSLTGYIEEEWKGEKP
jgi:hypothetical protein